MADVGHKICAAADRQLQPSSPVGYGKRLFPDAGGGIKEIEKGLLYFDTPIGIGDQVQVRGVIFEDATLQNRRLRLRTATDAVPIRGTGKERLYPVGGTPV
jgi:hypothetical protein